MLKSMLIGIYAGKLVPRTLQIEGPIRAAASFKDVDLIRRAELPEIVLDDTLLLFALIARGDDNIEATYGPASWKLTNTSGGPPFYR